MSSLAPPAPAYPTDSASTSASSDLGSGAVGTVVKVPVDGWSTPACLVASWTSAIKATSTSTERSALGLSVAALYSVPGASAISTAVLMINDLRPILVGTSFLSVNYDSLTEDPFRSADTRMAELQGLAPDLSLRQWADVFGVTKQTIRNWIAEEPRDRPELDSALKALRAALTRQPNLSGWLQAQLPGSDRRPLDLAKGGHWRAFRAASRMAAPVGAGSAPTRAMRDAARERRALSKRLGGADAPPADDEE
jgi:hypothetical protein